MTVKPVDILKLKSNVDNIYEAIVVMSKRARQVNEEMKIEFNQRIEMLQTKVVDPEEDLETPVVNPDQERIACEFELRLSPTSKATEEMLDEKVTWRYKEEEAPLPPVIE